MDTLVSALTGALSAPSSAHDIILSVEPPSPYNEWAEDEKRTDNIGDELALNDQRLRLLVHTICPEWVESPEHFAESRLTQNSTLKLDKIDRQRITEVCSGLVRFSYIPYFMLYFY